MNFRRSVTVAAVMLLSIVLLKYANHSEEIYPNKDFSTFPDQLGEWTGKKGRFDQKIYDFLGVDDSVLSNYFRPDGKHVELYVGFFQSQREGSLIHSPKNCMPGAGWSILKTEIEEFDPGEEEKDKIKIIKLLIKRGEDKRIVLYWFQSRGRIISSEYMQKIYLVIDSVFKHRTDGSFVRLISPFMGSEAATLSFMKDFIGQLNPVLKEYIPE